MNSDIRDGNIRVERNTELDKCGESSRQWAYYESRRGIGLGVSEAQKYRVRDSCVVVARDLWRGFPPNTYVSRSPFFGKGKKKPSGKIRIL